MRRISLALLLIALTATSGCAVKKNFYASGGSRADGTVDLAYDVQQFEQPVVDISQAQAIAKSKCQVWGYQDAEAFGGQTQHCNQFNGYGTCIAAQIVVKYQCLGNLGTQVGQNAPTPLQTQPQAQAGASGSLNKAQWQQQQLQMLQSTPMSYEEYQRRYQQIMAQ